MDGWFPVVACEEASTMDIMLYKADKSLDVFKFHDFTFFC